MATTNESALANFVAHKNRIDALLAVVQRASNEHFGVSPDDVNWGHVGEAGRIATLLERVAELAIGAED